ncbi:MAG: AAA family ATPase, partial [Dehalococcoidia bacterium]
TNYLHRGYNVIVEGLIISSEERGALDAVHQIADAEGVPVVHFYCQLPKDLALKRSTERNKNVPSHQVEQWWDLAEADRANVRVQLVELDMTAHLDALANSVLQAVTLGCR